MTPAAFPRPAATDLADSGDARRARAIAWIAGVHDEITALFTRLDGGGAFREDTWERAEGGGGHSRVMIDGNTFEKGGVNRSVVYGRLPAAAAAKLGGRGVSDGESRFFATGVSLVFHPRSPMIPTVHLNVRYFELSDDEGNLRDAWYGGGTDLTPMYPFPDDVRHFHRTLAGICDGFHPSLHRRFKPWCDEYFRNLHRDNETRGCGGVFFDHLRPGEDESGMDAETTMAFVDAIARSLETAYAPIVERRRNEPYGPRERSFQLVRRGRYVEFNLVHDRGTHFGLHTAARIESVLMSMPPLAAWPYAPTWPEGSFEAELIAMLAPRDWLVD
ncbi:MAG: oxygen-dependent coproporphyrinogen oxidase [Gemmatimonadota bacterium]